MPVKIRGLDPQQTWASFSHQTNLKRAPSKNTSTNDSEERLSEAQGDVGGGAWQQRLGHRLHPGRPRVVRRQRRQRQQGASQTCPSTAACGKRGVPVGWVSRKESVPLKRLVFGVALNCDKKMVQRVETLTVGASFFRLEMRGGVC